MVDAGMVDCWFVPSKALRLKKEIPLNFDPTLIEKLSVFRKRLQEEMERLDREAREFVCCYCGGSPPQKERHIDHVIPRVVGGPDESWNKVQACSACNCKKKDKVMIPDNVPEEFWNKALKWAAAYKAIIRAKHWAEFLESRWRILSA